MAILKFAAKHQCSVSTEVALRRPLTNDDHPQTWYLSKNLHSRIFRLKIFITYWFGVHQFWQFWRYCIYCYLSWYCTYYLSWYIAITPCATLICTYFDFLDIVVYLPKALLICYLFFIFWLEWLYPCFDNFGLEWLPLFWQTKVWNSSKKVGKVAEWIGYYCFDQNV